MQGIKQWCEIGAMASGDGQLPTTRAALSPVNGEFHEHTTLGFGRPILCAIDDVESRQVAISFVPE